MSEDGPVYGKYRVTRTDGSTFLGGKHAHCEHFVLDITHDPAAKIAAAAYADAIEATHPILAADMRERYGLDRIQPPEATWREEAKAPMTFKGIPLQMDPSFAGPPPAQQPVGGDGVEDAMVKLLTEVSPYFVLGAGGERIREIRITETKRLELLAALATPPSAQAKDRIRFDYVNADGNEDSKIITHDEMRERYAMLREQKGHAFWGPSAQRAALRNDEQAAGDAMPDAKREIAARLRAMALQAESSHDNDTLHMAAEHIDPDGRNDEQAAQVGE